MKGLARILLRCSGRRALLVLCCGRFLGLSIGAIFLLFALIRRNDATQVTSLMYLTPPTTAIMAWLMFGEAFNALGIAGMVLAVTGVVFVVKKSK